MFSSRSRLAPELENGRGKYNFQATKSQTVAGQDSGLSPVRTGAPCQPTGGTAGHGGHGGDTRWSTGWEAQAAACPGCWGMLLAISHVFLVKAIHILSLFQG